MTSNPKIVTALGGTVDEIETDFYEALQVGDLERLMRCWADDEDVVCVHPGGPRLLGLGAIRTAYEALLNSGSVRIFPEGIHKIEFMTSAVHSVREHIEVIGSQGTVDALLMATNVYHKTAKGWRMVTHHASHGNPRESIDITETPAVLH